MWQVKAIAGKDSWLTGWDYPENYFPRNFRYKEEAVHCANICRDKGGEKIEVIKVKK